MKLNEIQPSKNVLVMGASGTGKTTLVGSLAALLPTVIVTADEAGLDTLHQMSLLPDTEIILLKDWQDDAWRSFEQIAGLSNSHAAIALDDLGALQEIAQDKVELSPKHAGEEKARDKDKYQFELTLRQALMMGERRLEIQQWGALFLAVSNFLSEVLKLPYRVKLVTVLEALKDNPRTGQPHIAPALAGQVANTLPARFSLVADAFIADMDGRNLYCLSCIGHPRIETKCRYGKGRTWIDPTMEKVLAYINGKGEAESERERKIGINL